MNTPKHLVSEYRQFIANIRRVGAKRLESFEDPAYLKLASLLEDMTAHLGSDRSCSAVEEAAHGEDLFVVDALTRELQFFNHLATEDAGGDSIAAGETVKTSFENLLQKLPDWIKKPLKILNEILQLIKP